MSNHEGFAVRPQRVLIAGAEGFIGRSLGARLRSSGIEVFRVDRHCATGAEVQSVDLANSAAVSALLTRCRPEIVFHLTGMVGESDESILEYVHVTTTEALLLAVRAVCPSARVIVLGSAAEYGPQSPGSGPIAEDATASPDSPYGRSKLRQSELALRMARDLDLDVVRLRLFNTLGQGQGTQLVAGAMVERVHRALAERRQEFEVFDPDSERDYLDVGDVARIAWLVATKAPRVLDRPPIQVASGEGITVRQLAVTLLQEAGAIDRLRPVWIPSEQRTSSVGAPTTIRRLLGHEPIRSISVPGSLRDMWTWQVHHPPGGLSCS